MTTEATVIAPTEERHPGTVGIDALGTLEVLRLVNAEDALVAPAVAEVLPALARLVDAAVEAVRAGHTVHYVGAGTSGRLAVLDAAELLPTFNAPDGLVVAHHAGGAEALFRAVENVEDDARRGWADLQGVGAGDVVIGLTASGRTPYVGGALELARERGAVTALVTSNPDAELGALVDHCLAVDTGPEVVTGSTRLKAGTAQKLVLNAFSTAMMIRLGRTWSNLMVDVVATNAKLRGRVVRILREACGASEEEARTALAATDGELKPALVVLLAGVEADDARAALERHDGSVARALAALGGPPAPQPPTTAQPDAPLPTGDQP
ncbi:N-acetylmuramic acid 6-phosphate etherase [Phycicoccus endophyticus]|uniref:N-acetylmuramic acid 6-phosphate etherase n=1 Tax=Phycicoccus endophyticus TaxID=1690220 RepID=A0A7G9R040_9MICO|nr:N-acetylmuramic acid 6-phosphate etherase [Phycicoccus endophyticus]QNN48965.1 N-acetylmuramic acid 6-phosphate etherase [Phycicoccus endophyticus]GGL45728.1 N-acetylmuramic acid 6-phosphate etherase [Phycicoccus endophyticus]